MMWLRKRLIALIAIGIMVGGVGLPDIHDKYGGGYSDSSESPVHV